MKDLGKLILKFLQKNTGPRIAKKKMCTHGTGERRRRGLLTRYQNVL